jgi:hypothetical protein
MAIAIGASPPSSDGQGHLSTTKSRTLQKRTPGCHNDCPGGDFGFVAMRLTHPPHPTSPPRSPLLLRSEARGCLLTSVGDHPKECAYPPNNLRQNPLERSALRLTPSLSASSSWCRRRHSRTRSSYAADQSISHTRRATTTATTTMPSTSLTFLLFRRLGGLGPMSIAKSPLSLQPKERPPPAALAGRV